MSESGKIRKKIRCENCDRVIARGELPAEINIICKCGHDNNLSSKTHIKPFAERLMATMEKK